MTKQWRERVKGRRFYFDCDYKSCLLLAEILLDLNQRIAIRCYRIVSSRWLLGSTCAILFNTNQRIEICLYTICRAAGFSAGIMDLL